MTLAMGCQGKEIVVAQLPQEETEPQQHSISSVDTTTNPEVDKKPEEDDTKTDAAGKEGESAALQIA